MASVVATGTAEHKVELLRQKGLMAMERGSPDEARPLLLRALEMSTRFQRGTAHRCTLPPQQAHPTPQQCCSAPHRPLPAASTAMG